MARILVVTSMYPPHHYGGYEQACRDTVARWRASGHEVTVLTSDLRVDANAADDDPADDIIRTMPIAFRNDDVYRPPLRELPERERRAQVALRAAMAGSKPDVVSVWQMGALPFGLLTMLSRSGLPIVYVVLDDWLTYGHKIDPWMRLFATRPRLGRIAERVFGVPATLPDLGQTGTFCFISEKTRKRSRDLSPWNFPRSMLCYCGIDRTDFPPTESTSQAWGWQLLYVGRLDPRKGIETTIRALALLPPEARLDILPRIDEEYRHHLEALAIELGVADRVRFVFVDRRELAAHYRRADVLVFPSEWDEPFGLVPVEAMACATPVVATGAGGSAEYLRDGENCLLIPPASPAGMAAGIKRLASDPDLRDRIVAGGQATATRFDIDSVAAVLERTHLEAIAGDRRDPQHATQAGGQRPVQSAFGVSELPPSDAIARHQASTDAALASGDPNQIKQLYVELGDLLEEGHGSDLDSVPVLSRSETHPVVLSLLRDARGPILDAGCGPNPAVSIALAQAGGRSVVAADIGIGTVRLACAIGEKSGVPLLGIVADVEALPFRSGAFDGIACDDTIEHLPDDRRGVSELARVLTRGGVAALATPNRHSLVILKQKLVDRLRGHRRPASAYFVSNSHLREYTWREFEQLVDPSFAIAERAGVGWEGGWKRRLVSRLAVLPGTRRFGQMVVLAAKKK